MSCMFRAWRKSKTHSDGEVHSPKPAAASFFRAKYYFTLYWKKNSNKKLTLRFEMRISSIDRIKDQFRVASRCNQNLSLSTINRSSWLMFQSEQANILTEKTWHQTYDDDVERVCVQRVKLETLFVVSWLRRSNARFMCCFLSECCDKPLKMFRTIHVVYMFSH